MARRADPARIEAAHREGTRQPLLGTGMLPSRVDALIAAWEEEATRRGLAVDPPIQRRRSLGLAGLARPSASGAA